MLELLEKECLAAEIFDLSLKGVSFEQGSMHEAFLKRNHEKLEFIGLWLFDYHRYLSFSELTVLLDKAKELADIM